MKKMFLFVGMAIAISALTGCYNPVANNTGVPSVAGGIWISDLKTGNTIQETTVDGRNYVVLGQVKASVTTKNYCGLIAEGDASYATLKSQALAQQPGATDLINVSIDSHSNNLLGLKHVVTTELNATAIKYNK